jgi:hydroxypyruvate reductase
MTTRALLTEIYQAAVQAADARALTRRAMARLGLSTADRVHLISAGKAARRMADGARAALVESGASPAGGIVVTVDGEDAPLAGLTVLAGDHPIPAARSAQAAVALEDSRRRIGRGDRAIVLLSGGASSLLATPIPEVSADSLRRLWTDLLAAGAPIQTMNAIRRRVLRWGGGRLAQHLARAGADVDVLVASDVLGDDLPSIGSGPCAGDPSTARDVIELLARLGLSARVPHDVAKYLEDVAGGRRPETLKPGAPEAGRVRTHVIVNNATAVAGAAECARRLGFAVEVSPSPLVSSSREAGVALARQLIDTASRHDALPDRCVIAGGETTVVLEPEMLGRGGRCQELALVVARDLGGAQLGPRVTLLAAGTDGRDGPTDAAGAIVDGGTWSAIADAGRDPSHDLDRHDAYAALDAVGALLRTGATGTNVNDVIVGLVRSSD